MKKTAILSIFLIIFGKMQAQNMPAAGGGFPNIFGGLTGAAPAAAAPDTSRPAAAGPSVEQDPQDVQNKKLEISNKFIELQKQKIILEQELASLNGSGDTTRQDSINKSIKKKNLELLYLKEQMMLQTELEKYGYLDKKFPPSTVYGQEFFRNANIRMINTPSDISPSESYTLGTGDQIQVDIYGKAGYSGSYTVDEAGFITIPKMQKVFVKGKTVTQTRELLRTRFSQIVNLVGSNFDMSVSNSRTITVHVSGEVFSPGTYTLPALNSVFNILSVAGGPTNIGSLRNIRVQRGGVVVDSFDLYAYLFGGKQNSEIFLQNNDHLLVPTAENIVEVFGGLRRPGKYELKKNEGLNELIVYAAGLLSTAYTKDVVISRLYNNNNAVNLSLNWDSFVKINKNFMLFDGDKLNFKTLSVTAPYVAKIIGGVNFPGVYAILPNEKIADLIKRANGLQRDVSNERAFLIRLNKDMSKSYFVFKPQDVIENPSISENLLLSQNDELYIFTKQAYIDNAFVSTEGFVRNPQKIEFVEGMKASDLILLSGGIQEQGYAYRVLIERINPDFTLSLLPLAFDAKNNIIEDALLKRRDVIKVYPKPSILEKFKVEVYGEVNKAGSMEYRNNLTLKDVLLMSGGIKSSAEFTIIEIVSIAVYDSLTHALDPLPNNRLISYSINKNFDLDNVASSIIINPLDQIFVRKAYFNPQNLIYLSGEVKYPGYYAITKKDERILDVVKRAGGFTEYAFLNGAEYRRTYKDTQSVRLIVNLHRAQRFKKSRFNYFLAQSDTLVVPRIDQTVRITGSIENKSEEYIASYYVKGRRAKFYITKMAGGFDAEASKKQVYVQYANGRNVRTKNYIFFKVYPKVRLGSIITVPSKSNKKGKKFSFDQALTKALTTVTTALTLIAIINLSLGR